MNILSIYYLIFLAAAVTVYYLLPQKIQWCWLLAVSGAFFVLSCGWAMIPYLLFGVLAAWLGARVIEKTEDTRKKKHLLALTLVLILGELYFLKYMNFIPVTVNVIASFLGKGAPFSTFSILAPIGMAYYTLSLVGYVLDVYWGSYAPQKNPLKMTLFACYFPQMISGPVTRYAPLHQELFGGCRFDYTAVTFGAQRMLWGYFKKLLIAENLIPFIRMIFGEYWLYAGSDLVFATICYAFYLYADFSGCMDIVLGSSELFGIHLPENFRRPFFACTFDEFWRRWHMSMGVWFKEYLLYPLLRTRAWQKLRKFSKKKWGKKASKAIPTYLGLYILWLTIGFWHQGSWKFVISSGFIPGTYLILGDFLQDFNKKLRERLHVNTAGLPYRLFGRVRTFLLMCTVFFVNNSVSTLDALASVKHAAANFRPLAFLSTISERVGIFAVPVTALLVVLGVSMLQESGHNVRRELAEKPLVLRWLVYLALLFAVLLLSPDLTAGFGEFMYAQF